MDLNRIFWDAADASFFSVFAFNIFSMKESGKEADHLKCISVMQTVTQKPKIREYKREGNRFQHRIY